MTTTQLPARREDTARGPLTTSQTSGPACNVGDTERILSGVGGAALAAYGLSQGSLLGLGLAALGGGLIYRAASGHCSLYQALGVSTCATTGSQTSVPASQGIKVEQSIVINKPVGEIFRFWRRFENLPRFMNHLESVSGEGVHSHWVAKAPLGFTVAWDAEIINERPNQLIAWRSLPGSTVANAGSVHFFPALDGRSTEVRVSLKYDPPAGKLGAIVARLFGEEPNQQIASDLKRLKQILETGDSAASETPVALVSRL